jgi:hypothetical protein
MLSPALPTIDWPNSLPVKLSAAVLFWLSVPMFSI